MVATGKGTKQFPERIRGLNIVRFYLRFPMCWLKILEDVLDASLFTSATPKSP